MGGMYDEEERHNLDEFGPLDPPCAFRGFKAFVTGAADPQQGPPLTREDIDESLERLKENEGTTGTMTEPDNIIKVSVSATQKINLGNYESADVFFSLSNIPSGATEEQIEAALETGEMAFKYVKNEVGKQAGIVRLNMERQ